MGRGADPGFLSRIKKGDEGVFIKDGLPGPKDEIDGAFDDAVGEIIPRQAFEIAFFLGDEAKVTGHKIVRKRAGE